MGWPDGGEGGSLPGRDAPRTRPSRRDEAAASFCLSSCGFGTGERQPGLVTDIFVVASCHSAFFCNTGFYRSKLL